MDRQEKRHKQGKAATPRGRELCTSGMSLQAVSAPAERLKDTIIRVSQHSYVGVKFNLRYQVLPWAKLLPRRSVVSEATADTGVIGKYHTGDSYTNRVIDRGGG